GPLAGHPARRLRPRRRRAHRRRPRPGAPVHRSRGPARGHRPEGPRMNPLRALRAAVALGPAAPLLGAGGSASSTGSATAGPGAVSVSNCGQEVTLPSPAERMYVTGDGSLLALVLALGAEEQIAGVTGLDDGREALTTVYGQDVVDGLPGASAD